jgi:hypothetical protein
LLRRCPADRAEPTHYTIRVANLSTARQYAEAARNRPAENPRVIRPRKPHGLADRAIDARRIDDPVAVVVGGDELPWDLSV